MMVEERAEYLNKVFVENCNNQIKAQTINRYYLLREFKILLKNKFPQVSDVLLFGFTFRVDMIGGGKLTVQDLLWIDDNLDWEFERTNDAGYLFNPRGIVTNYMNQDNQRNLKFFRDDINKISKTLNDVE